MKVLRRDFFGVSRPDVFRLVVVTDTHVGARGCNEERLAATAKRIANDETCMWVDLGDKCNFINRSDPRFSPLDLPPWMTVADLVDPPRAQIARYLEIMKPAAKRCLAIGKGNHEEAVARHYERDVHREIVSEMKRAAGHPADYDMDADYSAWLVLGFHRDAKPSRSGSTIFRIRMHHGAGGGKLAGGPALGMQRFLLTHDCDIAIQGHLHITMIQAVAVEGLNAADRVTYSERIGAYCGTYMDNMPPEGPADYAEQKGYLPLPHMGVEFTLRPGADNPRDRIVAHYGRV